MFTNLILTLIASFFVLICLQIIAIRALRLNYFKSFMLSFALSILLHIVTLYMTIGAGRESFIYYISNVIIFGAASGVYLSIITLGETSIRFKIIDQLMKAGGKSTIHELEEGYKGNGLIEIRFARMIENKLISFDAETEKYQCNSTTWYAITRVILFLKILTTHYQNPED